MTLQPSSNVAPFRPIYAIPAGKALSVTCELYEVPAGVNVYVTAVGPRRGERAPEVEIKPRGPIGRSHGTIGQATIVSCASPSKNGHAGRITHMSQIAYEVIPIDPDRECEIQILAYTVDENTGEDLIKRRLWIEERPQLLKHQLDPTIVAAGEFVNHPYVQRGDTMFKATLKKTRESPPTYVIAGECDNPDLEILVISEPMPSLPDDKPQQQTVRLHGYLETNGSFEIPFSTKDAQGLDRTVWTILITSPAGAFSTIQLDTLEAEMDAIDADSPPDPESTIVTENPYAVEEGDPARTLPGGLEVPPAFQQALRDNDGDDGVFQLSADTDPGEDAIIGNPDDFGKEFPDDAADEVVGLPEPPTNAPRRAEPALPPKRHLEMIRTITPAPAAATVLTATPTPPPSPQAKDTVPIPSAPTPIKGGKNSNWKKTIMTAAALIAFSIIGTFVLQSIRANNEADEKATFTEVDERASVPAVKLAKAEPVPEVRTCEPHDLTGIGQANPRFFARKASEKPWNLWFSIRCEDGKIYLGHKGKRPEDGRTWWTGALVSFPPS